MISPWEHTKYFIIRIFIPLIPPRKFNSTKISIPFLHPVDLVDKTAGLARAHLRHVHVHERWAFLHHPTQREWRLDTLRQVCQGQGQRNLRVSGECESNFSECLRIFECEVMINGKNNLAKHWKIMILWMEFRWGMNRLWNIILLRMEFWWEMKHKYLHAVLTGYHYYLSLLVPSLKCKESKVPWQNLWWKKNWFLIRLQSCIFWQHN